MLSFYISSYKKSPLSVNVILSTDSQVELSGCGVEPFRFCLQNGIYLGVEAGIQEDVGGLEVSVDDCRLAIFM